MRTSAMIAAALALVLAGCAEESLPTDDEGFEDFELEATETTGVIRGVVVDATIVPVADATVRLDTEDGPVQTSNEAGEFAFSDVEAGIHYLLVDRDGYGEVKQQIDVVAGVQRPPVVTVQLLADPSELPVVVPLSFQGYIDCSISTPAYRVAACSLADPTGDTFNDNFMIVHEDLAAGPSFIQSEMLWSSTQSAGEAMTYTMEHEALDGGEIAPAAAGPSPLVIQADQQMIEEGPFSGQIMHRVFNYEHPQTTPPVPVCGVPNPVHGGDMCVKGLGATVQQDFEIFTHVFYRFAPQDGWQFSVDGPPATPA